MPAALDPSDLASLAALDALLHEANVTRAARRVGLSTPAMSHALARLRARLGDPLLVRAGREMVLTPRALALRAAVREALGAAEQVFAPPPSFDPTATRRSFTLCATDYVLLVFGADFDARLQALAPGFDLRVLPNAVDDDARLREGSADLAIGIYASLPPELRLRPIISDRLVCVLREGHPAAGQLDLARYAALEHVQVAPRGQPGGYVDEVLAAHGLRRRVVRAVPWFHVAFGLVAGTDRVLTVSARIAHQLAPGFGLAVHEPPVPLAPFALSLVWHPRFDADPAHRWLREQLVASTTALHGLTHPDARRWLRPPDPPAAAPADPPAD